MENMCDHVCAHVFRAEETCGVCVLEGNRRDIISALLIIQGSIFMGSLSEKHRPTHVCTHTHTHVHKGVWLLPFFPGKDQWY